MIGILARFLRSTMVNRLLLMRRNVSLHGLPGSRQMAALREVGETESVRPGPFAPFTGRRWRQPDEGLASPSEQNDS